MTMECEEASVPREICRSATVIATDCLPHCALQQANSAQSLAASSCSCSTSTCTDFSSSEGGFDEYPTDVSSEVAAAAAAIATTGASADTSVSMLSLTFSDEHMCNNKFSSMKATSQQQQHQQQQQQQQQQQTQTQQQRQQQTHQPQQQQQQNYPSLGPSYRPHSDQKKQRRRSNAISAKSRSSYLAQYNEVKCAYFDGVLSGDIPVKQTGVANRFN